MDPFSFTVLIAFAASLLLFAVSVVRWNTMVISIIRGKIINVHGIRHFNVPIWGEKREIALGIKLLNDSTGISLCIPVVLVWFVGNAIDF